MKVRKENADLFLIPETDLVADRIEALKDFFSDHLKSNSDASHILLDVTNVDLVDSLGINLIVGLYRQVTNENRTIEIIGAGKNFMKVANFFRLPSLLSIKPLNRMQ